MSATPSATIIAGRYSVNRPLGQGSFGEVYEVFDHNLNQVCALKLLRSVPPGVWDEAQVLQQVRGEYVLPVLNADLVSGRAYIVTDLATRGTVGDQITPGVGVPISQAVRWARNACQGVARLHDHKLLHCDIKPENLFLDVREEVLVGDLGLSQLWDDNGLALACGTPETMAPEVASSFAMNASAPCYSVRSDVYSLGATLFWMLNGCPPLPEGSPMPILVSATRPDLWEVAPHVTRSLRDIVNKAIAHDPAERYATPADLDAALGGRDLPARCWTRVVPHAGHVQCFRGDKTGASQLLACAIPTGTRTQVEIAVTHAGTGRNFRRATRITTRAQLNKALRAAFRACR